ncbi:Hypothetical predicted protein [Prunus dulcis]|uniref:Uncharacterized protein n=1 Tax=Prunus dulcis TaxID=3755 RepID=A0A5E4GAU2_PRUDU|nr:Hypothetical predicted protein [Prunus dulcis]
MSNSATSSLNEARDGLSNRGYLMKGLHKFRYRSNRFLKKTLSLISMKHISLSPSTELAKINISFMPFRTLSSPRSPSPLRCLVHQVAAFAISLVLPMAVTLSPQMDSHLPFYEL